MTKSRSRRSAADWSRMEALGRALAAVRSERGFRRPELAEAAGVSYTHLSEIENGKKEPSSRTLHLLAEALGVRPSDIQRRADALFEEGVGLPEPPAAEVYDAQMMAIPRAMPSPSMRARAKEGWFHEQAAPAAATRSAGKDPDPVEELLRLARDLPPEDVERLLDLARRLHRR